MPETIRYCFTKPEETPKAVLDRICDLVSSSGGVGTSWIRENLEKAFLIGYALSGDRVVGTSTHKISQKKISQKDRSRDRPRSFGLPGKGLYCGGPAIPEPRHRFTGHSRPYRKVQRATYLRHHRHEQPLAPQNDPPGGDGARRPIHQ